MGNQVSSNSLTFLAYDKQVLDDFKVDPICSYCIDRSDFTLDMKTGLWLINVGDTKFYCSFVRGEFLVCEDQIVLKPTNLALLEKWMAEFVPMDQWSNLSKPIVFKVGKGELVIMQLRMNKVTKKVVNMDNDSYMVVETESGKGLVDLDLGTLVAATNEGHELFLEWLQEIEIF